MAKLGREIILPGSSFRDPTMESIARIRGSHAYARVWMRRRDGDGKVVCREPDGWVILGIPDCIESELAVPSRVNTAVRI